MSAVPSATANERLREILHGDRDRHEDRHAIPARPRRETPSSGLGRWPFDIQQEGKAFFSEEKKQKTFGLAVAEVPATRVQRNKSFLGLFFKKEPLASLVTGQSPKGWYYIKLAHPPSPCPSSPRVRTEHPTPVQHPKPARHSRHSPATPGQGHKREAVLLFRMGMVG